jgi:hypothetical protein
MPAFQIVALDTITPQLRAPATGDTYSAPRALALAGETLTGSQATPTLDITQTWNTTGTPTAYRLNVTDTASNAGSLLMDLQTGGTSRFSVDKNGRGLSPLNSNTIPALATSAASDRGFGFYANRPSVLYGTNVVWSWQDAQTMSLGSTSRIAWTSGNPVDATPDLFILRDATDILAQRRTTNAQMFRIYETFTDASNYSRMEVGFDAGNLAYVVRSFSAGTGTLRPIALMTGSNVRWSIGATTGHFLAGVDNTYDIGASGATRPRNIFAGGDIYTQSNTTGFYLGSAADVALLRDEANVLAQRRSTNAQAFRIYNTFTSSTDYERGFVRWSANALQIGSESAGTGAARGVVLLSADHLDLQSAAARSIRFAPAGTTVCWLFNSSGHLLANADNTYDIGASAASRPKDVWVANQIYAGNGVRADGANGFQALAGPISAVGAGARLELAEVTAPTAPTADRVRIYAEDNGAGKTRIMARFATGAAVQIAIEP